MNNSDHKLYTSKQDKIMDSQSTLLPTETKDQPVWCNPVEKSMKHKLVKKVNAGAIKKTPEHHSAPQPEAHKAQ